MLRLMISRQQGRRRLRRALGLGQIAADEGNSTRRDRSSRWPRRCDPDAAEPYSELGKLLLKSDEEAALRELERGGAARRDGRLHPQAARRELRREAALARRGAHGEAGAVHRPLRRSTCTRLWRKRSSRSGGGRRRAPRSRRPRVRAQRRAARRAYEAGRGDESSLHRRRHHFVEPQRLVEEDVGAGRHRRFARRRAARRQRDHRRAPACGRARRWRRNAAPSITGM